MNKRTLSRATSSKGGTVHEPLAKQPRGHQRTVTSTPARSSKKKVSKRYFTSLGVLTKKFVTLIRASDGVVDLNSVATKLGVQKRRIYDITNVLDGIGLIEKKPKGFILWKGHGTGGRRKKDKAKDEELHALVLKKQKQLQALNEEEELLETYIRDVTASTAARMEQDAKSADSYAYIRSEEVRAVPDYKDQTIIVVRAKKGTTLEVPDPDEGLLGTGKRRFQIFLNSSEGPIELFLASQAMEPVAAGPSSSSDAGVEASAQGKDVQSQKLTMETAPKDLIKLVPPLEPQALSDALALGLPMGSSDFSKQPLTATTHNGTGLTDIFADKIATSTHKSNLKSKK